MIKGKNNLKLNNVILNKQEQQALFERRLNNLLRNFPKVKKTFDVNILSKNILPDGATYFPILTWRQVSGSYEDALNTVFDMIKFTRGGKFQIISGRNFSSEYLWKEVQTVKNITMLCDSQLSFGVKIIPAQLDGRYAGVSANQLNDCLVEEEFSLDLFTVGLMILSDKDLIVDYRDVGIACSGSRIGKGDGEYNYVPVFSIDASGDLVVDLINEDNSSDFFSSATGYVLNR